MDLVQIGGGTFGLSPAYAVPEVAKAMAAMEKQFKPQRALLYFWDCETQKGLPDPRFPNFSVRNEVGIKVFDPDTGKVDSAKTDATRSHYARSILGKSKKDIRKLVNAAVPPVPVPVPYSMLDRYRRDFHIKMYAEFKRMFYLAYLLPKKVGAPIVTDQYMWLVMARDFKFKIKLISRCDGKKIELDADWKGTRKGYPEFNEIDRSRYDADEYWRKEAKKSQSEDK